MKLKLLSLSMVALSLLGCASKEYNDNLVNNQSVQKEIAQKTTFVEKKKVTYISKPPQSFLPIESPSERDWLKDTVTVNVDGMPLSVVLEEIMAGIDFPVYFGEGINPNKRVTLNYSNSRENVLNLLSREAGASIELTNKRIEVSNTVTRTFSLNLPTGVTNGQLGSQGGSSKDGKAKVDGQYLNVKYSDVDITTEIANDIKTLLGGGEEADKAVSASINLSSITVTATPDQMLRVVSLIEHYQAELSKQVLLDVRVLEFRSNLGTERGVDWNVAYKTGEGLLKFFVPGTNTVSEQAGYGMAFQGTGKWSGTEALIKVLEKQGSVATQTPITALVLNNQPSRITQETLVPSIYETSTESSDGVISASVTRAETSEGVDFMASANVQDEHVWLRLSGQLQKISNQETKKVHQVELGFLTKQKSEINFSNKLRYGQTYVIASVKQTASTAEKTTNFWSDMLGGTGSQNSTVETLVLLTPRKVK